MELHDLLQLLDHTLLNGVDKLCLFVRTLEFASGSSATVHGNTLGQTIAAASTRLHSLRLGFDEHMAELASVCLRQAIIGSFRELQTFELELPLSGINGPSAQESGQALGSLFTQVSRTLEELTITLGGKGLASERLAGYAGWVKLWETPFRNLRTFCFRVTPSSSAATDATVSPTLQFLANTSSSIRTLKLCGGALSSAGIDMLIQGLLSYTALQTLEICVQEFSPKAFVALFFTFPQLRELVIRSFSVVMLEHDDHTTSYAWWRYQLTHYLNEYEASYTS